MKEFLNLAPKLSDMVPLTFYLLAFFLLSLSHPSFFFNSELEFANPTPEKANELLSLLIAGDTVQLLALACGLIFLILLPGRLLYRGQYLTSAIIAIIALSTLSMTYFSQPLSYVVLYFFALTYHFISWGIFIGQKFSQKAPQRLKQYLLEHIYIVTPLTITLLLLSLNITQVNSFQVFVYNGIIFIMLAMIHNTTSLLNEEWFKKMFQKYV